MITRGKENSSSISIYPNATPRTTDDRRAEFARLNFNTLQVVSGEGKLVSTGCIPPDVRLFRQFLHSEENRTFPTKVKVVLTEAGELYIKSVPGSPHEYGVVELTNQFVGRVNSIESRLGGNNERLLNMGNQDHVYNNHGAIIQSDVQIKRRNRGCANFFGEIRSDVGDTAQVIHQSRRALSCANARYALAIDILEFTVGNIPNKQVRILAHLFQKNVNNNWAPISITSFGNYHPGNQFFEANGVVYHLFNTHYPGYRGVDATGAVATAPAADPGNLATGALAPGFAVSQGDILLNGIGFDPAAPVCDDSAASLAYYRLALRDDYIFEGNGGIGIRDNTGLTAQQQAALPDECYIDLYYIQRGIRSGFFRDGSFAPPIDPDCYI